MTQIRISTKLQYENFRVAVKAIGSDFVTSRGWNLSLHKGSINSHWYPLIVRNPRVFGGVKLMLKCAWMICDIFFSRAPTRNMFGTLASRQKCMGLFLSGQRSQTWFWLVAKQTLNFGLNDIYMQIRQGKIFKASILAGQDHEGLINCH